MSIIKRLVPLVWILGVAALAMGTLGALTAPGGKVSALAIAAAALSAAVAAALALSRWQLDHVAHYRRHHKPLAGPRTGARLPG